MTQIMRDFINNSTLLFALVFLYGALNIKPLQKKIGQNLILGLVIGGFAILLMENPWRLAEGLIFDTRSVLISVTGAFFSPLTTVVAASIGMIYRIGVGGAGVYAGLATYIVAAGMGLAWQLLRQKFRQDSTNKSYHLRFFIDFVLFGLATHIVVMLCQIFLIFPHWNGLAVAESIAPFFLILYPLLTGVLAIAMINQIDRLNAHQELMETKRLLQAAIDSPQTMGIFAVDQNLCYLSFNEYYCRRQERLFANRIHVGDPYLPPFSGEAKEAMMAGVKKALTGEFSIQTLKVVLEAERFVRAIFSPISDDQNGIFGATVFVEDVTEQVVRSEENRHLSYHDYLTGLHNRRFYGELMQKIEEGNTLPLVFIIADINGLKLVNDAFGHHAGDELLRKVSQIFTTHFGENAKIMRIGGDEFVIVLEGESPENAAKVLNTVKSTIEQQVFYGINASVSFGSTSRQTGELMSDVMKRAESEMYNKKLFEVSSQRAESIRSILNTLYVKNPREEIHSRRVSDLCYRIGEAMELSKDALNQLKLIGNLHDIGKIAIDEAILNKPGKLTAEEWVQIQRHPEIGYRILASSGEYAEMSEDILAHHERWDGKGYPKGLKNEQIPWRARIIAVADSFDAMTAPRPYRQAVSIEDALEEILRCAGTQFDPVIAQKFVEKMRENAAPNLG